MSDSTIAVSSKYTQDLSVQIVFFKIVSLFLLLGCNLSYNVDLFADLHELASASARTLLKLASSVRALLKPYGDTLSANTSIQIIHKYRRIPYNDNEQGSYRSWKTWKVIEFIISISRPGKSWNLSEGHKKSWKSNIFSENKKAKRFLKN